MIKVSSDREFRLEKDSLSAVKKINLKDIGFNQISSSNLYIYQSQEYKILNYSIKPLLIFFINSEDNNIYVKLKRIDIKNLPNIFNTLNLTLEVKIFRETDLIKINRHISLGYESKNKFITLMSNNLSDKILRNLIEKISMRFDKKLTKKVLKAI